MTRRPSRVRRLGPSPRAARDSRPVVALGRVRVSGRDSGSVLVGLLWCLALLALLVVGMLHSTRMDLQVARHDADRIQGRYLALAGVERAKALLYHDARDRSRSAQSHGGRLANDPREFRDVPLGRGTYRVLRAGGPGEEAVIYGVSDEESRLNLNIADAEMLSRLPGMTPDLPPAILDWRDGDRTPGAGGAEIEYYAGLQPPSRPRDGPFPSVRELLAVRGVPRDLFFGDDPHGTGFVEGVDEDPEGGAGAGTVASRPAWVSLLTVHSGVRNVSAAGRERVSLTTADEAALTSVRGISPEIARAIIAHRGQNRMGSIADLLDVGPAPAPGSPNPGATAMRPGVPPGVPAGGLAAGAANPGGPKVIDENLLLEIADDLTTATDAVQAGAINVNTAGVDVLACLPGVDRELAQAVVNFRASNGFLANTAWLLRVPGMTRDLFKQIAGRVTTRSETFRVLAEGRVGREGVVQRILATIRVEPDQVRTLAYREDDL